MHIYPVEILAEDDVFRVEISRRLSLLHVLWKRHVEGELLREKYQTIFRLIDRFKPRCWLGNARALHYTTLQDARWFFDQFVFSLFASSVTKYARLEAHQSLLLLDSLSLHQKVNNYAESHPDQFEFRFFTDEGLALEWLSNCAEDSTGW
ncbi:MAG: hypothetical protein LPK03_04405 [Pontibacter sp.]|nr:hypothetical protein [Pontibacter sp.]